ncbi:hypothetical protein F5876DRAFT_64518 [Lentinula aff. lateritia]|uniref:Uncharacterized protein n=1 Tax=Lentinula aff. lateritia TaxID=2804960 RepID=A0ACC1U5B6_9AGAR|nr:hypothetical protein F5876DRAFT_64518 [Lentinula aff. lateritia]
MKRLRTYIHNGSGKSDQTSEEGSQNKGTMQRRHPPPAAQNEAFEFPSPQASHSSNDLQCGRNLIDPNTRPPRYLAATSSETIPNQRSLHVGNNADPIVTPNPPTISRNTNVASSPKASVSVRTLNGRIRKPAPVYSSGSLSPGGSVISPSPRPTRTTPVASSASGISTISDALDISPSASLLPSAPLRYSRSKSVRILVPDDAVFGTFSRSISSPDSRRASGRSGFGSSFASSRQLSGSSTPLPSPLEAVLEYADDSGVGLGPYQGREHTLEQTENLLSSSFSDSEAEDDGKDGGGGDGTDTDDDLDENLRTSFTETQSVRNSMHNNCNTNGLDMLHNLPASGVGVAPISSHSHSVSWVSNVLNSRESWAPSDHRSRNNSPLTQSLVDPRTNPKNEEDMYTMDRIAGSGGRGNYLHIQDSTSGSPSGTLGEHTPETRPRTLESHRHSHPTYQPSTHIRTSSSTSRNISSRLRHNYTPLLPGMSSVIALERTEYLIILESFLEGPSELKHRHSSTGNVRVRVVGGRSTWREHLHPGYAVMFIEDQECLVNIVKELVVEDHHRTEAIPRNTPAKPPSPASDTSDSDLAINHNANPHYMSWRPGMHITVTLAGVPFLVVQVERLSLLKNAKDAIAGEITPAAEYNHPMAQIAGISEQWWALPENGSHVVLILGTEKRRRQYLVRVIRRLTTTSLALVVSTSSNDGTQAERASESPGSDSTFKVMFKKNNHPHVLSEHLQEPQSHSPGQLPRSTSFSSPSLPSPLSPQLPMLPPSVATSPTSDVLVLAKGYRYLTGSTNGSGSLRFELLLEDRTNDLYASYMLPSADIADGRRQSLTWFVSGGQSRHDASWVFKKDGKTLHNTDGRLSQGSRSVGRGTGAADLPHHFLFEKQTPNDAWVFKPALENQIVSPHLPFPSPEIKTPPDLDELLASEGSTFRKKMSPAVFVSRLVLRKDRDMVVFYLSPASKEQVRELSRRIRKKREEANLERQKTGECRCDIPGTEGTNTNEVALEKMMIVKAEENHSRSAEQQVPEILGTTISHDQSQQKAALRVLRYGRQGELIFVPWDSTRLRTTSLLTESEVPTPHLPSVLHASPSRISSSEYPVYGKVDSQSDVKLRQYIFYPIDHDDIKKDIKKDSISLPDQSSLLQKFTFKTYQEDDAWIFVSIDGHGHVDGPSLTVPLHETTGTKSVAGVLFRASIDGAGKITLHQMPIKSSLTRPTLYRSNSASSQLSPVLHSTRDSFGSVQSESNILTKRKHRRRPLSEQLSETGLKLSALGYNIRGSLKSLITESRPTLAGVHSQNDFRSKKNPPIAL